MWIKSAEYIDNYIIEVIFEDGTQKIIDIKPFLTKSTHPSIKKFLDIELFKKFKVEYGALCWEGNQFDISPEAIYRGDFDVKKIKMPKTDKSKTIIEPEN